MWTAGAESSPRHEHDAKTFGNITIRQSAREKFDSYCKNPNFDNAMIKFNIDRRTDAISYT